VGSWDYVPGAYIIEYEQGHVSWRITSTSKLQMKKLGMSLV
jgi:hypothetical protein